MSRTGKLVAVEKLPAPLVPLRWVMHASLPS